MFGRLTDAQLLRLQNMLDVRIGADNAATLYAMVTLELYRAEIEDELKHRQETPQRG